MHSIAAVESLSQHPLAKAIVNFAHENGVANGKVGNFQSVTGKGAYGTVLGVKTYIGSIDWAAELV